MKVIAGPTENFSVTEVRLGRTGTDVQQVVAHRRTLGSMSRFRSHHSL